MESKECPWCRVVFEPSEAAQTYCTRNHARKSRQARKKLSSACPRPDKIGYEMAEMAEAHAEEINRGCRGGSLAYLCKCGKWHVGNIKPPRPEFIERVSKLQAHYE